MATSSSVVVKTSGLENIQGFTGAKSIISDFYATFNLQNDGTRRRKIPFSLRQNQEDMLEKLKTYYTDVAQRTLSYINSEALLPVLPTNAQFIESSTFCFEPQAVGAVAPLGTLNLVEWYRTSSRTPMNTYGLATKWEADRLGDPDGLEEYLLSMAQILKGIRLFVEYDGFQKVMEAGMPDIEALMDQPDMQWYNEVIRLRDYFGQGNHSENAMHAGFDQMRSEITLQCDFEPSIIMVPRSVRPLFGVRSSLATRADAGGERAVSRFLDGVYLDRVGQCDVVEAPMVNMRSDGMGAENMLRNFAQVGTYYYTDYKRLPATGLAMGSVEMDRLAGIEIPSYDTRRFETVTYRDMVMNDLAFGPVGQLAGALKANHPAKNKFTGLDTRKQFIDDYYGDPTATPPVAGKRPKLDYVIFRPYAGVYTYNTIIAKGGSELGYTGVGQIDYYLSQDNQAATASNGTRVRLATHIANAKCAMTIPHYFYDKVLPNHNGSTKFFTKDAHDKFIRAGGQAENVELGRSALIACSFPCVPDDVAVPVLNPVGSLIDVCGYTGHGDDIAPQGNNTGHYPSSKWYRENVFNEHLAVLSVPSPQAMNRQCFPGTHRLSSTGAEFDVLVEGQGFDAADGNIKSHQIRHIGTTFQHKD
jgi:hypothetical protein